MANTECFIVLENEVLIYFRVALMFTIFDITYYSILFFVYCFFNAHISKMQDPSAKVLPWHQTQQVWCVCMGAFCLPLLVHIAMPACYTKIQLYTYVWFLPSIIFNDANPIITPIHIITLYITWCVLLSYKQCMSWSSPHVYVHMHMYAPLQLKDCTSDEELRL